MQIDMSKNKDSELLFKSSMLLDLLIRDAEHLLAAGIEIHIVDDFASKISEFRQLPSEVDLINIQKTVKRSLAASRIDLSVVLRQFESSARYAWGGVGRTYSIFNNPKMNMMTSVELMHFARRVRVAAGNNIYELISFGMTKAKVSLLQNLIDDYFVAIKNMARVIKYCNSIRKASEIKMKEIKFLIKILAGGSYDMWIDSNDLKAQDYEIFIDKKISLTPPKIDRN